MVLESDKVLFLWLRINGNSTGPALVSRYSNLYGHLFGSEHWEKVPAFCCGSGDIDAFHYFGQILNFFLNSSFFSSPTDGDAPFIKSFLLQTLVTIHKGEDNLCCLFLKYLHVFFAPPRQEWLSE